MKDVGEKIPQVILDKKYLEAAKIISSSLHTIEDNLQGIEALKQVGLATSILFVFGATSEHPRNRYLSPSSDSAYRAHT